MSAEILYIVDTTEKQDILIIALEQYATKCRSLGNRPTRGYGNATEKFKKENWLIRAEKVEDLLNEIVNELN